MKILGLKFCLKTIFAVFTLTFILSVIQNFVTGELIHDQPFMSCVLGASFCGAGIGIAFSANGIYFDANEIFISDGSKSDTGNIGDILRHDNSIGVTDPIYPAYIDSNVSCGRAGTLEKDGKWSMWCTCPAV